MNPSYLDHLRGHRPRSGDGRQPLARVGRRRRRPGGGRSPRRAPSGLGGSRRRRASCGRSPVPTSARVRAATAWTPPRIPARLPDCPTGPGVAAGPLGADLRDLDDRGAALAYSPRRRAARPTARHPVGLIGAAGAARAAGDVGRRSPALDRPATSTASNPTYYGAAWLALGGELLGLGNSAAEDGGNSALAWGRSAASPGQEPTTTAPPDTTSTTETPTTAPPTTAPPTTAPPTTTPGTTPPTTSTPPTSGGAPPTSVPASGSTTGTTRGASLHGPDRRRHRSRRKRTERRAASRRHDDRRTTCARGPGGAGTGDLSTRAEPGAELRAPWHGVDDPDEPARRRTGGIALAGLSTAVALGAVLGLRERGHVLRIRRRAIEVTAGRVGLIGRRQPTGGGSSSEDSSPEASITRSVSMAISRMRVTGGEASVR